MSVFTSKLFKTKESNISTSSFKYNRMWCDVINASWTFFSVKYGFVSSMNSFAYFFYFIETNFFTIITICWFFFICIYSWYKTLTNNIYSKYFFFFFFCFQLNTPTQFNTTLSDPDLILVSILFIFSSIVLRLAHHGIFSLIHFLVNLYLKCRK